MIKRRPLNASYWKRVTESARGEAFNPLLWPFLLSTLAYGVGFSVLLPLGFNVGSSTLYTVMAGLASWIPPVWGAVLVLTLLAGVTFLLFNIPPVGRLSGLAGFAAWTFAAFAYLIAGDYLVFLAVTVPNMWFWFWQYLSLSRFRREEEEDRLSMNDYSGGGYDDEENPRDSKTTRENNRGVDRQ